MCVESLETFINTVDIVETTVLHSDRQWEIAGPTFIGLGATRGLVCNGATHLETNLQFFLTLDIDLALELRK